jgi:apolipoprotein N-acyltransferase
MVRSANNGVSAIIDGYGRIIVLLSLGEAGVIDGPIPQPLPPTPYSSLPALPLAGYIYAFLTTGLLLTKRQLTGTSDSRIYTTSDR